MKSIKWNKELLIGTILVGFITLIALISCFYTPYDPDAMDIAHKLQSPSPLHLMGTDQFGRDVLSRIMVGTRLVLIIGLCTTICSLVVGSLLGIGAGYFGGMIDTLIMKLIEVKMAFPGTLLALMLIALWGSSMFMIIIALSMMNIPRFTRVVRSGYLQYEHATFVESAVAVGLKPIRIMFVHILPNLASSIYVTATLAFSSAVLSEAGLSYLGLGLQPPLASWGKMLSEAQAYMLQAPYLALIPGIMITLVVLGFNFLADGLRKL